jgi:uncharacterized protein YxeA
MSSIIIIAVLILVIAIILLSTNSPLALQSKEDFIKQATHYLEGKCDDSAADKGYHRIDFKFEEQDFIYEEIDNQAQQENSNKAYLRTQTKSKFTLTFTEKEARSIIRSEVVIASDIPNEVAEDKIKVNLPIEFSGIKAFSNDPKKANTLFLDNKIKKMFLGFKNFDTRGCKSVSLKIVEGEILLEFFPLAGHKPSLLTLHRNVASFEDYLDKLLYLTSSVNNIEKT